MLFEKVLLATDYSPPAEQLFKCLPELKNSGMKEVVLVHVADTHSAGGNVVEFQKHSEEKLESYKKELEEIGLKVTIKVPIGYISEEINRLAEEENVSLILVGSHGKGIIKSRLLGSSTTNILRKSTIPVLVEKYKNLGTEECEAFCKQKFLKMLIPTDFSSHAMKMIEKIKKANHLRDIVLLTVIEKAESREDIEEQKSILEAKLKALQKDFEELGFTVSIKVREGTASDNILQIASYEDATVIAMPKKGAGNMKELLVGSTADAVARKSEIPVLLFPAKNS